ncbi:unnamed protein product [Prorocentrum cordatum]|uniref:Uncharacterized protein n=1 Tax=Prorocentrum cordatum TaxID=2364126 RepID=A0ABN9RFI8_9DINO|nr:unnamed protein product [Polarella glacialis]
MGSRDDGLAQPPPVLRGARRKRPAAPYAGEPPEAGWYDRAPDLNAARGADDGFTGTTGSEASAVAASPRHRCARSASAAAPAHFVGSSAGPPSGSAASAGAALLPAAGGAA